MLNISGMNRSCYIRNFTDMRCKYARILSVIRHQPGRDFFRCEVLGSDTYKEYLPALTR